MTLWRHAFEVAADDLPVFRRIASAIVGDIERGRLVPGTRLPSSRALAAQLGVNRNTVIAAYDELRALGWAESAPSRGMFVVGPRPATPEAAPARGFATAAGFALPAPEAAPAAIARPPGLLILLGGVPDVRFVPHVELARAYRSALRGGGRRGLLDYGDPLGDERLRDALGDLVRRARGIAAGPESICVVRGGQQGVYLAARALLRAGDVVAVEEFGYRPAWEALRLAGATLVPIRVDGQGLDVDGLATLCGQRRVRAVYLTPHHQCPTGVTLSPSRRAALLALARRERMIVLEDDYDFDFHYDGKPRLPLAASDPAGVVVHLATMSKLLAPGIRLGYVVAPVDVIRRIADYRTYLDRQGDRLTERAVAMLIEDGDLQRHTRRALRAYRSRRDLLCAALRRRLPDLEFTPPSGGMSIWARAPGVDVDRWVARGLAAGVAFQPASRFTFDGRPRDFVRIGFAACDEVELAEAARRMAATLRAAPGGGPADDRGTGSAGRRADLR